MTRRRVKRNENVNFNVFFKTLIITLIIGFGVVFITTKIDVPKQVNIKLGEEFVPTNTTWLYLVDVTDITKVYGNVDTSEAGKYKLEYNFLLGFKQQIVIVE